MKKTLDTVREGWGEFYKEPREKKGFLLGRKQSPSFPVSPVKTLVATGVQEPSFDRYEAVHTCLLFNCRREPV